ncbi:EexN family lipoprotein [Acidiphilium sp. AL]|uniref:EexN family lipoprotein n=1 Tax=Acidiphilium iwatense TaxID=768198 RepID=A0ABS9DQN8_9PROT|nr:MULTISPECIES: EexN family lipoprotein [Acidiphilium]MCF3945081.1 EexN family lipoprotein [Acidiphilium iwatense]MCU4160574.1 EexN family lipoprotein [Acidiphilium sp. AL]
MKPLAILLILATALLAGCADSTATYYHKHPHTLMREVVRCENNGGALANTPLCRKVLRINSQLF